MLVVASVGGFFQLVLQVNQKKPVKKKSADSWISKKNFQFLLRKIARVTGRSSQSKRNSQQQRDVIDTCFAASSPLQRIVTWACIARSVGGRYSWSLDSKLVLSRSFVSFRLRVLIFDWLVAHLPHMLTGSHSSMITAPRRGSFACGRK